MAITFGLYTDSGLTISYSGITNLLHNTNLSDNPQDFQFFLGSINSGNLLQDLANPGVSDIELIPTDILPEWAAATAYTAGQSVEPTVGNGLRYECTVSGTSHASVQPTWPTTPIGATVTDGTVTWQLVGASHQTTEVKLATTQAGLDAAVAGGSLTVGPSIQGGAVNAYEFWMRVTNAVTNVSNNTTTPEISVRISDVRETY